MFANSRKICSSQTGPHAHLREVVSRHLASPYERVPSAAGCEAFATVIERLAQAPFVLDAGCGTGASSLALAREFPDRLVLGIDKSAARLKNAQNFCDVAPANLLLLRCELVDFWQLAAAAGLRCARQYLFYPNPWPKPKQLKRRWHAHPVLPEILALGGEVELRTNWRVYAEEFALAFDVAGLAVSCEEFVPEIAFTPFERKYAASGHALWRCRSDAGHRFGVTRTQCLAMLGTQGERLTRGEMR